MQPQAVAKLEVLEAMAAVKTEHSPPHAGPPHAHEDAVCSLAGLALPLRTHFGHPCHPCCCSRCGAEAEP